ncbi:condensation protein [Streptomyces sp. NPDC091217]|uniref:condensation protein n=1 Tax=Streptomyces sp. NPDC091217 TaxID=3365975 RepID=UPI003822481A
MTGALQARRPWPEQDSPAVPCPQRVPFGPVDEVSRHCLRDAEPETVHIEVHLPGRLDPDRLRNAFTEALRRHPRTLVREAAQRWYRRRYEWEVTGAPDVDPVTFAPPGPDALELARARAVGGCPPLSASPPVRLEVVDGARRREGCVLVLRVHHTALDAPSGLRILATAAEAYGGAGNAPAPAPARAATPVPPWRPAPHGRPVRIAADASLGGVGPDGMLLLELPLPGKAPRASDGTASYTVNDQLLVATSLTVARWNRLHGRPAGPVWVTMPVDDRPRDARMPMGNGTRLLKVPVCPQDPSDEAALAAERPDPDAVARLLRLTARRTRVLKAAAPGPPLGRGTALLTAPVLPVGLRRTLARGLRGAAAPWAGTALLSNIGRVPHPLDFGDAGRARAVWFSAPARMPAGLALTAAGTGGCLHVAVRWSRALLDDEAGARLGRLFARSLAVTSATSSTFRSTA